MRIIEFAEADLRECLRDQGLIVDCGAATVRIWSDLPELVGMLRLVYGAFPLEQSCAVVDVSVTLRSARGLRRHYRPQAELWLDGERLFEPYPRDTLLPLLEWGLNFALAKRMHNYLLLHSGVAELHGRAVVLAAMPGSGKSTLTAALSRRGFRLLSDEFGVVQLTNGSLLPLLRPVALKNESIEVIARFAPEVVIGPRFPKTRKGTVAHMGLDASTVDRRHLSAKPGLVIFPRYDASVAFEVNSVPRARAFARLAVNSFNYEILGRDSFEALGRVIRSSECYEMRYSDLGRAIDAISSMVDRVERCGEPQRAIEHGRMSLHV